MFKYANIDVTKKSLAPATVVPWLESSDVCPASSAKLSARHSGAATQRNSKLCSARPSRCRNACKDLSSVKLTSEHPQLSLESPHDTSKHLYIYVSYIIHPDPSSSSSPSFSDILVRSSVILHPSSIFVQSRIRLSSFIMLASKSRTPRGIQVQGLNTTRQMRHQILQMLATEMLQSCKGQLHLTARGLISCVTIITWDHIEHQRYIDISLRCLVLRDRSV